MFNTIYGAFASVEDAMAGIAEYCSTDAAVSEAYDAAYDAFVADEACSGTYWDCTLTSDDF